MFYLLFSLQMESYIKDCELLKNRLFQQVGCYVLDEKKLSQREFQEVIYEKLKNKTLSSTTLSPPLNVLDMVCDTYDKDIKKYKLLSLSHDMLIFINKYYLGKEGKIEDIVDFLVDCNPYPSLKELYSYNTVQLQTLYKINRIIIGDATSDKLISKFISTLVFIGYTIPLSAVKQVTIKEVDIFEQDNIIVDTAKYNSKEKKEIVTIPILKIRRKNL